MKTIIFTAALSLLTCAVQAQETPPAPAAPETVKKAKALPAAWLGIQLADTGGKTVIDQVAADSPAGKAGLQKGDILVRIGDIPIEGKMERVIKSVTGKQPGEAIEVHWQRGDKEGATRIELGARPEPAEKDFRGEFRRFEEEAKPAPGDSAEPDDRVNKLKDETERALKAAAEAQQKELEKARGNLQLLKKKKDLLERDPEAAAFLGVSVEPGPDGKLAVTGVVPESPAAKAGLQKGDLIVRIGDIPIKGDVRQFVDTVGAKKPGEVIALGWQRGEKEVTAKIELAQRPLESDASKSAEEFRSKLEFSKNELERNLGKLRLDSAPDSADTDKMLRFYLDREWPGDKADDTKGWKLRFGKEVPLFERQFEGGAKDLKGFHFKLDTKEKPQNDDAIWKRVQKSVAGALEKSGVGPDVREKVMQAVEDARRAGSEEQNRRSQLEAEAAKLEKEMQNLKARADKLREELKKSAE